MSLCEKVHTSTNTHISAGGAEGAGYPDNKVMLAKCDLISPQNNPGRIASKGFGYTEKNPPFGIFFMLSYFRGGDCLFSFLKLAPQTLTSSSTSYNVFAYPLFSSTLV